MCRLVWSLAFGVAGASVCLRVCILHVRPAAACERHGCTETTYSSGGSDEAETMGRSKDGVVRSSQESRGDKLVVAVPRTVAPRFRKRCSTHKQALSPAACTLFREFGDRSVDENVWKIAHVWCVVKDHNFARSVQISRWFVSTVISGDSFGVRDNLLRSTSELFTKHVLFLILPGRIRRLS